MTISSIYLIKVKSKKFSLRLYPSTLNSLTLSILENVAKKAKYNPILLEPTVLNRNPIVLDLNLNKLINSKGIIGFSVDIRNLKDSLEIAKGLFNTIKPYKIIFGGPQLDKISSKIILEDNQFIDYIVSGYGEKAFKKLLINIKSEKPANKISGIFYRKNNYILGDDGKVLTIQDLKENSIAIETVSNIPLKRRKNILIPIRTSIGCNGVCSFCYLQIKKWVALPAKQVINLFSYYTSKGFEKFLIIDDNFIGTDQKRAEEIAEGLINLKKKYPKISLEFDARSDSFGNYISNNFNHNLVKKLINAGLKKIFVGIDSGNLKDLKFLNKNISNNINPLKQNIFFLKNINKHNILIIPGFIMLREDSTPKQIKENIKFITKYLPPQIIPEIFWYTLGYYAGSRITTKKIKDLERLKDNKSIKDIVYGDYTLNFKDLNMHRLYIILNKVKKKLLKLENILPENNKKTNYILNKFGRKIKMIHKKFFLNYLALSENGMNADNLIEEHYSKIKEIIKREDYV